MTGLLLGHRAPSSSRRPPAWRADQLGTIQFLLENAVFLLIGLQVRRSSTPSATPTSAQAGSPSAPWFLSSPSVRDRVHAGRVWVFPPAPGCARTREPGHGCGRVVGRHARRRDARRRLPAARGTPQREVLALAAFVVTSGPCSSRARRSRARARLACRSRPREDALQAATVLSGVAGGPGRADEVRAPGPRRGHTTPRARRAPGQPHLGAARLEPPGSNARGHEQARADRDDPGGAGHEWCARDEGGVDHEVLSTGGGRPRGDDLDRMDGADAG